MRPRVLRFKREREYPMTPAEAWRLLANTDHLNRSIGLPPVSFSAPAAEDGFVRLARAKAYGAVPVRWREYPFDWVRERRYAVRREFEGGPLVTVEGGVELEPAGDGRVRVKVFADLVPRNRLGRLVAARLGSTSVADVLAYCDRYLSRRSAGEADPLPTSGRPRVERAQLERLLDRLATAPVRPELVRRLRERILTGSDEQVLRVRPYELAEAWAADRPELLRLFLYATRAGLFELRWELMCPTCRVPKDETGTLAALPDRFHCDTCGIEYAADFDRRVELRFSVHPSVRAAEDRIYCIGGPFRTPHVLAQQYLRPGESRTVEVPLGGAAELRAVGGRERLELVAAEDREGPRQVGAAWDGRRFTADETVVPAGDVSLTLRNESDTPLVAVLEGAEWAGEAATAAEVTALQDFRDLFSSEVLAPGREVGVRAIALLFSDLKGSTSLYEGVGDAPAYGRVSRHFEFLREKVAGRRGTIVKTIGDAVMGAFISFDDALAAAIEIQRDLAAWCTREGIDPPFVLRVGIHEGPAVAVNANDRIDYFGRTVNVAARVEGESQGGDVVLVRELAEDPRTRAAIAAFGLAAEPFTASLRGIEREMELVRLRVPAGVPAERPDAALAQQGS